VPPTPGATSHAGAATSGTDLQRQFAERVRSDAARLRDDPAAVAMARELTLAVRPAQQTTDLLSARGALARVERTARLSSAAPVDSARWSIQHAKAGLARLMQFYVGHVVHQVAAFTSAAVAFDRSLVEEMDQLRARVEALEEALGERQPGPDDPGPGTG
jgi:hypothetical protein